MRKSYTTQQVNNLETLVVQVQQSQLDAFAGVSKVNGITWKWHAIVHYAGKFHRRGVVAVLRPSSP